MHPAPAQGRRAGSPRPRLATKPTERAAATSTRPARRRRPRRATQSAAARRRPQPSPRRPSVSTDAAGIGDVVMRPTRRSSPPTAPPRPTAPRTAAINVARATRATKAAAKARRATSAPDAARRSAGPAWSRPKPRESIDSARATACSAPLSISGTARRTNRPRRGVELTAEPGPIRFAHTLHRGDGRRHERHRDGDDEANLIERAAARP